MTASSFACQFRSLAFGLLLVPVFGGEAFAARLVHFNPQGEATGEYLHQVTANFDAPVRPLGDLDGPPPLTWSCDHGQVNGQGKARWVDVRTWAVDFTHYLPAGVSCEFKPVAGLKDAAGQPLVMAPSYRFHTGGPSVRDVSPAGQDHRQVAEDAVFIVRARGDIDFSSVEKNAWCEIDGVYEKVPAKLLSPAEKKEILTAGGRNLTNDQYSIALLRCARRLPNGAKVVLNWGAGIKGSTGIATSTSSRHEFRVREEFSVKVRCQRENAKSGCNPFSDIALHFTAPVMREDAEQLRLVGPEGKLWQPDLLSWGDGEGNDPEAPFVNDVRFKGRFPAVAEFRLQVPAQLRDDAGRALVNRDRLAAVTLNTADYPPLLKFAADFGIVERKAGGLLPVTLRNLDPLPGEAGLQTADGTPPGTAAAVTIKRFTTDEEVFAYKACPPGLNSGNRVRDEMCARYWNELPGKQRFLLPKPHGAKPMEVVGIPLGEPGLYHLAAQSLALGRSLLDRAESFIVHASALNTNLAVHFKKGAENQLVWVTALDTGKPVAEARISIRDCSGKQLAFGKTTADGTMAVKRRLPANPRHCGSGIYGYYVSARATQDGVEDFSFTLSQWQQGIEPWRYQLPGAGALPDILTHAVFDRPLFRAGETVHIKHFARRHTTSGYSWVPSAQLPLTAVIQLEGSDIRYELPLAWKGGSAETSWTIPVDARLGKYWVSYLRPGEAATRVMDGDGEGEYDAEGWWPPSRFWRGGSFRVAEFRLPVLKGEVATSQPRVWGTSAEVDLKLNYLAGGAAAGEKVRLRSEMTPLAYYQAARVPEAWAAYQFSTPPIAPEEMPRGGWQRDYPAAVVFDDQREVVLDAAGVKRVGVRNIPAWPVPGLLRTEMEYVDPAGEVHTAAATMNWYPSAVLVGIAAAGDWTNLPAGQAPAPGKVKLVTLDNSYQPLPGTAYKVRAWQIKTLVHRKRLVGGMYSYDTQYVPSDLGVVCEGQSDARGAAECTVNLPAREKGVDAIQVVFEARAQDAEKRASHAATALWLSRYRSEGEEQWYQQGDSDRIDLSPERKKYEPGESAAFTVQMPFREATALVTVEREGIIDRFVTPLSGKDPVVRVPIKANYGPNVYVSVLVVRGRVGDVQPTALVDLGKPAYKLGIAEIEVGRQGYELKVTVEPAQAVYRTREQASVRVKVLRPDGSPARGGEFALAAVDEALLELAPNKSWDLLTRLLARRGYAVETSTAQSQVIGKRHFGLKAVPAGGGGGRQPTRELFDTLISWQASVLLDDRGEAVVKLPLNDSLTKIRVVAVAHAGPALFGTGMASFRTTKDVQVFSGLPPVVRDADRFRAGFTVRNLTGQDADFAVAATVSAQLAGQSSPLPALPTQNVRLAAGEGRELAWPIVVPAEATRLDWRIEARAQAGEGQVPAAGASDALKVRQKVLPALPVRVTGATLEQLDGKLTLPVQRPRDALPGRGSIDVFLKPTLGASTDGVHAWMEAYPYLCLEQRLSRALATGNLPRWDKVQSILSTYLDNNGLAAYFPNPGANTGSPTLTANLLTSAQVSGRPLPAAERDAMLDGLARFVEGRIAFDPRYWSPREDLPIRKLKALEALARYGRATPQQLATIAVTPGLWPTSGVVAWLGVLQHMPNLANRATLLAEAENQLRSRMVRSGTLTRFAREREDYWWWLMDSPDGTVARAIATLMDMPAWQAEIPRLVRGVLARQREGHWDTTTANAWGVIMLDKFRQKYEAQPVSGVSEVAVGGAAARRFDWADWPAIKAERAAAVNAAVAPVPPPGSAWRDLGGRLSFGWPASGSATVSASHTGSGKPWLTVQTRAARALTAPQYAGFEVKKEVLAIDRKRKDRWSKGDIAEVRLSVSAPTPWTWVVIDDPVPAGATILGSGLGGESAIAAGGVSGDHGGWWGQAVYTERAFDAYRAYYEYFRGDGKYPVRLSYRMRLNNAGEFTLPPTHVEAMYAPENFGDVPNAAWSVAE